MLKMTDINNNLRLKRVMIREDLNVPLKNGKIMNDARIKAALPTIQHAIKQQSAIILLSHLGRPTEGQFDEQYSLRPVARRLEELLGQTVRFMEYGWLDKSLPCNSGQVVLCENVRFLEGEKENNAYLAKRLAQLCDVFVMDAFATAHRAHASTEGVAKYASIACAGPLLIREIEAIEQVMKNSKRPLIGIVGGSKVSTKLEILKSLIDSVDQLMLGGGIANTFIAANGYSVGNSLYEADLIDTAKELMDYANKQGVSIPMPTDVVVARECTENAVAAIKKLEEVTNDDMILDIGPQTAQIYAKWIGQAGTILWNGPVGVFELEAFSHGTHKIARAIALSNAFSLAGGGDTIAAIEKYGIQSSISYISTGGGAFLELIEGKELPGIAILKKHLPKK